MVRGFGMDTILYAPSGLAAAVINQTQINLSWTDNSLNESNSNLQRATDSDFTFNVVDIPLAENIPGRLTCRECHIFLQDQRIQHRRRIRLVQFSICHHSPKSSSGSFWVDRNCGQLHACKSLVDDSSGNNQTGFTPAAFP